VTAAERRAKAREMGENGIDPRTIQFHLEDVERRRLTEAECADVRNAAVLGANARRRRRGGDELTADQVAKRSAETLRRARRR